jgi:23S rRNA maturation-related 3'-5' exoribonuclease YhaM
MRVVRSSAALGEVYTDADRDLLLTAAALHDIGKIQEYDCRLRSSSPRPDTLWVTLSAGR